MANKKLCLPIHTISPILVTVGTQIHSCPSTHPLTKIPSGVQMYKNKSATKRKLQKGKKKETYVRHQSSPPTVPSTPRQRTHAGRATGNSFTPDANGDPTTDSYSSQSVFSTSRRDGSTADSHKNSNVSLPVPHCASHCFTTRGHHESTREPTTANRSIRRRTATCAATISPRGPRPHPPHPPRRRGSRTSTCRTPRLPPPPRRRPPASSCTRPESCRTPISSAQPWS